jgi:hypothetical protein
MITIAPIIYKAANKDNIQSLKLKGISFKQTKQLSLLTCNRR